MSTVIPLRPMIDVSVESFFIPDQSRPEAQLYFFGYRVRIHNRGPQAAQLLSRHWIITDGYGRREDVSGPGVVGQTPTLKPGDTFEYTSACPLPTPTGKMSGSYTLCDDRGREFRASIPEFQLVEPSLYN